MFKCPAFKVSFAHRQFEYKGRLYAFLNKEKVLQKLKEQNSSFHLPSPQVYYQKTEAASIKSRGELRDASTSSASGNEVGG